MTLEQILGERYRITTRLPAQTSTHQRYALESTGEDGGRYVLSFRDYSNPVSATALAQQEQLTRSLTQPPLPLLCRALEWSLKNDFNMSSQKARRSQPAGGPAEPAGSED